MSGDSSTPAAPAAPTTSSDSGGTSAPSLPSAAGEATAPRTTADIAANVIERAANAPEPDEPAHDASMSPADVAAAKRFSEEEELLREFGFKRAKRADGSEHTIPRSKVLSMIASGLKRGTDRWGQERQQLDQELQQLRGFRDGFAESLRGDERQFLAYVAQHDPRYKQFLEPQGNGHRAQAHEPESDEPQADIDLGNGATTYSKPQLQKWLQWAMDQRLAPIQQEREQAQRQAQEQQAQQELRGRVRDQVTTAQQWPAWSDYEGDILAKLQADTAAARRAGQRPRMTLREAYLEVKSERLEASGDPARVREKVLADINAAPRSTAIRTNGEVPRTPGIRTTSDVARAIIEKAERGR